MTQRRLTWLSAIVVVSCVAVAGCGTSGLEPVAPTPTVTATSYVIDVAEINGPYSFYPSPATVRSDKVIVWRNFDTVTHHVVFDDMSVDTGTLAPGTVSQPIMVGQGNWAYHCAIHPSMSGTVTVTASAGTATVAASH